MNEPLEVHVFGAKRGESIVLRLPGDHWGVVDIFTSSLKQPENIPTVKFLRSRGVKHLNFVCLTHPHYDHYNGMSYLLENFPPQRVWLFGAASSSYLWERLAFSVKAAAEAKPLDAGDSENADELVRILDRIQAYHKDKQRVPRVEVRRLQLQMPLLDLDCDPPIHIISIGASGGQALQYEHFLEDCFNAEDGALAENKPKLNHNMISSGLLIEYGKARVVLGGDIDAEAWNETIRTLPSQRLRSELVKISHHGSATGYCDGLWEVLSPGKTAVAVLTPFSSQGLPCPEGLGHIIGHAKSVYTASMAGTRLATNWYNSALDASFQGESADVLLTLRSVFSKTSPSSEKFEGRCSFLVQNDGTVDCSVWGEAGCLTAESSQPITA